MHYSCPFLGCQNEGPASCVKSVKNTYNHNIRSKENQNRKKYVANVKSLSSIEGVGAKIYYVGQNIFLERKPPQNFAILKFFAKNVMTIANGATDLRVGFCLPK